jgi:GntR family transcriptional regulator
VEIADILGIERSEPMLCIRSTSWTAEGERYDVYETWVRSDIVPLEVSVGALGVGGSGRTDDHRLRRGDKR